MSITMQRIRTSAFAVAAILGSATVNAAPANQPGNQARWSLDFRVRLEQQAQPPVEIHLTGDWASTIVAARPAEYDAQLQIENVHFAGDAAKTAPAASLEDLQRRLSRSFWATYRADGELEAIHFRRDVSPTDSNLLQMIATELQFVRPDSAPPSWTAQERDGAGEYLALYVKAQPDRVMKRKLKYVYTDGVAGAPTNTVQVIVDQSSVAYSLSSDGEVQTVDGTGRMHMEMPLQGAEKLSTVVEIHVGNRRSGRAPELIGSLARALPNVKSSSITTHKVDPAEAQALADKRLLEGHTSESLLADAFAKDGNDAALADRLAALFRCRPEAASEAVALLSKNGAQRRVTDALGVSGSLSSIAALATVARNASFPETLRVDAVVAFVQMQHPSAEAMRVPADLMLDPNLAVRSAARMMSGALARAGRVAHPDEADAIDSALIGFYRKADDTRDTIGLLGALGNSAGPAAIPVLEEALHDARVPVRTAAIRALRWAPGPDIDQILASAIEADPDSPVRADAIFAARFRRPIPPQIVDALLIAASSDTVDYVRSNAVALLRQNPTASPRIPQILSHIADNDKNPGIRRQASDALAAISATASAKP
jgi:HEAT repeat protein